MSILDSLALTGWQLIQAVIFLVVSSMLLYCWTRLVTAAYFRSKHEFVDRLRVRKRVYHRGAHNISEVTESA